jgi:hypothetical protein
VIWYDRDSGTEVVLGVSAVCLGFLGFGVDSSNQNLAEYIGAIIAVSGQVMLGYSGRSLALRGDSVTALTWAISERPRGKIVTNASIVWTLLCVATNIDVRELLTYQEMRTRGVTACLVGGQPRACQSGKKRGRWELMGE